MATVEGSHLTSEERFEFGMDLMEKMLDGLEGPEERFDQILGCMDFLLM